jgi:hypothetical protein
VGFGSWSVRSMYRPKPLNIVAKKLLTFRLHLMGVQEVRGDRGSTEGAEDFTLFDGRGN